jgi:hypothetical protein
MVGDLGEFGWVPLGVDGCSLAKLVRACALNYQRIDEIFRYSNKLT